MDLSNAPRAHCTPNPWIVTSVKGRRSHSTRSDRAPCEAVPLAANPADWQRVGLEGFDRLAHWQYNPAAVCPHRPGASVTSCGPMRLSAHGIQCGLPRSGIDRRSHAQGADGYAFYERRRRRYTMSTVLRPLVCWGVGLGCAGRETQRNSRTPALALHILS
jgi:hypothetical protein